MRVPSGEIATHIARHLSELHGESLSPVEIVKRAGGEQGYSGSAIRYYDVTSRDVRGALRRETVVSKDAVLLERRILEHLSARGCAVPPLYMPDPIREGRAPVYMPYLEARLPDDSRHPWSPTTLTVADGLAGIHATNLGRRPSWLPLTADGYLDRLWLRAWREQWEANLADPTFRSEFGACTAGLDAAMEQFMAALEALTAEEDALTLLNVDLHPRHIRFWRGEARFIDWEQASYGPLYLDLPNHFTVETALIYRDALARHGAEIPVLSFMDRFHEMSRYMGLRYLGAAMEEWTAGGKRRAEARWFLYYTIHLALHGR